MNAINDVGIPNLSVVATTDNLEILETNGNAVTITNVTNDARNNPFVGVSNTSGLESSTPAIEKANVENSNFAISNKTSTSFDIVLPSGTARLVQNNGTIINYGANLIAMLYRFIQKTNKLLLEQMFSLIRLLVPPAGTPTPVVGTPDLNTFFINGVQAYVVRSHGNFHNAYRKI